MSVHLPQESEQLRSTPASFLSATATEKDLFSTRLMFLPNGASAHWNLHGLAKQNEASVKGKRAHRTVIHVVVAHCVPPPPLPPPTHTHTRTRAHTHLARLYCHRCTSAASSSVNTVRLFRCKSRAEARTEKIQRFFSLMRLAHAAVKTRPLSEPEPNTYWERSQRHCRAVHTAGVRFNSSRISQGNIFRWKR